MKWNDIKTKDDIDTLVKYFGGFNESFIKEISYISGAGEKGKLINCKREVRIVLQRKSNNKQEIEMIFEKIIRMNLAPVDERYDCIITDIFMDIIDDEIYWADGKDFDVHDIREYDDYTWICSEGVKWREIKEV